MGVTNDGVTNTLVCTYLVICDLVVKSRDLMDRKTSKQPRYCKETTKKTSLLSKAKWLFATSDTCRFRRLVDATKSNARRSISAGSKCLGRVHECHTRRRPPLLSGPVRQPPTHITTPLLINFAPSENKLC